MNKSELIEQVQHKMDPNGKGTKDAAKAVESVLETIRLAMADGEEVVITGFGKFEVVRRAAKQARNPRTGEALTIPARKAIKFTPGKGLKETVQ